MKESIIKKYSPRAETAFYILLSLKKENHGYSITQEVETLTQGEVVIGAGTMYGSLNKFEGDGLINFIRQEDKRKYYRLTDLGHEVLELEEKRVNRILKNIEVVKENEVI